MQHDNRASLIDSIYAVFPDCDLTEFADTELIAIAYSVWNEHGNVYEHETAADYLRDYVSEQYSVIEQDARSWAWEYIDAHGGLPDWLQRAVIGDAIADEVADHADRIGQITEFYIRGMGRFVLEDLNV